MRAKKGLAGKAMKILHIISSSGMYGAESVIVNLCRSFDTELHQSMVAVFLNHLNPNLDLYWNCRQQGIEVHLIGSMRRVDWGAIGSIRKLALSTAVDLVHAHGYKADVLVHLALRRSKPAYVATCHNWFDEDRKARIYGYVDRRILSQYRRIAAVSDEVVQRLYRSGVDPERVELIRNGIDVRPYLETACERQHRSKLVVGFVGRLSWEKGPDIFLRAASDILRCHGGTEFLLAGDGPEFHSVEQLANELGIGHRIRLLRHVRDMASLYQNFDIMVCASRREGLPIAVLEGMASGLPVIATQVGEVPMIIRHGHNGMLVPPEDPHQLAQTILGLMEDSSLRSRLGSEARRFVTESFSADRMAKEYLQFYEKAMLEKA